MNSFRNTRRWLGLAATSLLVACGNPAELPGPVDEEGTLEEVSNTDQAVTSQWCAPRQTRVLKLPNKADVIIYATPCVQMSEGNGFVRGFIHTSMIPVENVFGSVRKFDAFTVGARVDSTSGASLGKTVCNLTTRYNSAWTDEYNCFTPWVTRHPNFQYQADGWVKYGIDGDGIGTVDWQLTGTQFVN